MSLNVDGMISGLDTSALVKSLLQAERQPQVRLQAKRADAQKVVDVYQQLNTRLDALRTAAEKLNGALDWGITTATTSNAAVLTAVATSSAPATAIAFSVTSLAQAHAVASDALTVDPAATVVTTGPITIGATSIDVGGGTMNDVAAAVNAAGVGVTASVVQVAPGQYRLHLAAKTSGAASAFTVGGNLGSLNSFGVVTQASDAAITVGDGPGAYSSTSSTNTFTDLMAGTTLTVHALGAATVTVTPDSAKLADNVEALAKSYNDALSWIRANSSFDAATKKAGVLLADSATARLTQKLNEAVTSSIGGSSISAASLGLSIGRDGVLTFDRAKLLASYEADPTAVAAAFHNGGAGTADDGIAERLRLVAQAATDTVSGSITTAIAGRKSLIADADRQIAAWDDRLSLREQALRKQFSNLETMLGKLRNQSSWLAGQVSSLGGS